jgi:hypothetical protein
MDSDDIPMKFFCQLKDPRKSDNFLYRVFLPIDNENNNLLEETFIDKIELNEDNLKNQIIIDKPKFLDDEEDENDDNDNDTQKINNNFKPFKIIEWRITKELKSFHYITSELKIDEYSEEDWNKYHNSIYLPSSTIKVGGTPVYTQKLRDIEKNPTFLQITESKELPYEWGDSGIAHISEDLKLDWDCY